MSRIQPSWRAAAPGMSWHHMIPHATLVACWDSIAEQLATDSAEAHTAAFQYLTLCNHELPAVRQLLRRLRTGDTISDPKLTPHRIAGHARVAPLEVHERNEIERAVAWPPWNAVEGPNNRSDDPGDQFEIFLHGATAREQLRMRAIQSLYKAMQIFLAGGPGVPSLRALIGQIQVQRDSLKFEKPIDYRADMWTKGDDGKWRNAP